MSLNVLVSSPSSLPQILSLPYVYGLLKTHCEQDETISRHVDWLEPICRLDNPEKLLEGYDLTSVDVLGLSCYMWNWLAQREIARRVKEANPECLVVAGGPHCDYDDPEFFRRNPYLDIVVEKEGEKPFRRILRERISGSEEWEEIPGLYLRDEEGVPSRTAPPELLDEDEFLSVSPYEAQSDVFERIIEDAKSKDEYITSVVETNRGCPYRCTFCDWGSLTYTKVRKFDEERVRKDIRFLAKHEVNDTGIVDANVGMFERDLEFVEYLCECKERYGGPQEFGYNPTKTKATYLPQIMKTLHDHGLIRRATLSVQHTVPEVLDAIERKNLTREELDELIEFSEEENIPIIVQLILGCPNDTYDRWKRCLTDLMEWGVDGYYSVFNFQVLPNAPVAEPDYMEEWEIELTTTNNVVETVLNDETSTPRLGKKNMITSTSTYDEDDWVRMWVYSHFVRAFHSMGLTHRLALYLRYAEDVSFLQFYEGFVDDFVPHEETLQKCMQRLVEEKREFLQDSEKQLSGNTELELLPESSYQPLWEEWLFIHTTLNRHEIYRRLEDWIVQEFSVDEERWRDLVRYQREIVVNPDYDPRQGKVFEGQYDWVDYFSRDREELTRPPVERPRRFVIDQHGLGEDSQFDIRWHYLEGDERLETWIEDVIMPRNVLPGPMLRKRSSTLHQVGSTPPPTLLRRLREKLRRSWDRTVSGIRSGT